MESLFWFQTRVAGDWRELRLSDAQRTSGRSTTVAKLLAAHTSSWVTSTYYAVTRTLPYRVAPRFSAVPIVLDVLRAREQPLPHGGINIFSCSRASNI